MAEQPTVKIAITAVVIFIAGSITKLEVIAIFPLAQRPILATAPVYLQTDGKTSFLRRFVSAQCSGRKTRIENCFHYGAAYDPTAITIASCRP